MKALEPMPLLTRGELAQWLMVMDDPDRQICLGEHLHVRRVLPNGGQRIITVSFDEFRDDTPQPKSEPPKISDLVKLYREARAKEVCPDCAAEVPLVESSSIWGRRHRVDGVYYHCKARHIIDAPLPCITEELGEILHAMLWNAKVIR